MPDTKINREYHYGDEDLIRLTKFYRNKNIENENVIWATPCSIDQIELLNKEKIERLQKGQKLLVPLNTGVHWVGIVLEKTGDKNLDFTLMNSLTEGKDEASKKSQEESWMNKFKDKFKNIIFTAKKATINVWEQQDVTTCGAWAIENLRREGYQQAVNVPQRDKIRDGELRAHHCNILADQGMAEKQFGTGGMSDGDLVKKGMNEESIATAKEYQEKALQKSKEYNRDHATFDTFNENASLALKKNLNEALKDSTNDEDIRDMITGFKGPTTSPEDKATLENLQIDTFLKDGKDVLLFKEQLNNLVNPAPSLKRNEIDIEGLSTMNDGYPIRIEDILTRDLANTIHENATPEFRRLLNNAAANPSEETWKSLEGKLTNDLDKEILHMVNSEGYGPNNNERLKRLNQFVNHFDNIEDKSVSKSIIENLKKQQESLLKSTKTVSSPDVLKRQPISQDSRGRI